MSRLSSIVAAVRSRTYHRRSAEAAEQSPPFITISRRAGAGEHLLVRRAGELPELDPPGPGQTPWNGFDKELVEKVSQDHNLHKTLVDLLGEQTHSWLHDVFAGLTSQTTETQVYRRVAETVRGLAQGGRVVIVGRGGVFITQNMPRGVHIQVVAPAGIPHRADGPCHGCDHKHAANEVRRIDQNRESFYKHTGRTRR
ncbi:MAG: cytidylate kinase family protein [Phycisphaerales bacterium]